MNRKVNLSLVISRILADKNSQFYRDQYDEVKPEELKLVKEYYQAKHECRAMSKIRKLGVTLDAAYLGFVGAFRSINNEIEKANQICSKRMKLPPLQGHDVRVEINGKKIKGIDHE